MNLTASNINCGPCSILTHVNDRLGTNYAAQDIHMSEYSGLSKFFKGWSIKNTVNVNKGGLMCDDIRETYDDMIEYMKNYGEGASGLCSGHWTGRSDGHFIEWKVVDNTVIFADGQNGRVYLNDAFDEVFSRMDYTKIAFTRLDKFEINKESLKDIVYKGGKT